MEESSPGGTALLLVHLEPVNPMYHRPMGGPSDLTAFILAGGKSTRMGADKAFVTSMAKPCSPVP